MSDPWRNVDNDLLAAFEHMESTLGLEFGALDIDMFEMQQIDEYPIKDLYRQMKAEGVADFKLGELSKLDDDDLDEIEGYRDYDEWADNVLSWLEEGFPAIIMAEGVPSEVIDEVDEDYTDGNYMEIVDGRGRSNIATAIKIPSIPVLLLIPKNPIKSD